MPLVRDFIQWIGSLAVQQTILSLVLVSSLMVAIEERRISAVAFLNQCVLLSLLLAGRIYQPVAALKGLIGIPITMILYISASHIESQRRRLKATQRAQRAADEEARANGSALLPGESFPNAETPPPSQTESSGRVIPPFAEHIASVGTSPSFRILVVALGAAGAYGLWQAYPIPLLPSQINLACYWLLATGLLLAATSQDPLRTGVALLTLLNGFETGYYTLNTSLMLVGLIGTAEILIALATANASERWLTSRAETEKETS
jgi:hypothetical protein